MISRVRQRGSDHSPHVLSDFSVAWPRARLLSACTLVPRGLNELNQQLLKQFLSSKSDNVATFEMLIITRGAEHEAAGEWLRPAAWCCVGSGNVTAWPPAVSLHGSHAAFECLTWAACCTSSAVCVRGAGGEGTRHLTTIFTFISCRVLFKTHEELAQEKKRTTVILTVTSHLEDKQKSPWTESTHLSEY